MLPFSSQPITIDTQQNPICDWQKIIKTQKGHSSSHKTPTTANENQKTHKLDKTQFSKTHQHTKQWRSKALKNQAYSMVKPEACPEE